MPDKVKIIIIGDEGVGKSALTLQSLNTQLCLSHFPQSHEPTADDCIRKPIIVDDEECVVEIIDTAGRDMNVPLTERWIAQGDAFVLVYSIASQESFQHVWKYFEQVREIKRSRSRSQSSGMDGDPLLPVILVANKHDLRDTREVSRQAGMGLARELDCEYVETSAKQDTNVEELFVQLVWKVRSQRPTGQQLLLEKKGIKTPSRLRKGLNMCKCTVM
ncbi:P-loop containing nucleoside triphosphate hydrolase protein [Aspergillus ambiguus]|uniref:P-loop containing nucleoside triphosphate hydrolase protein n=1 Tax=Aspergillus ambiguus TaxID=176160 RepID=UPI003CCCB32F